MSVASGRGHVDRLNLSIGMSDWRTDKRRPYVMGLTILADDATTKLRQRALRRQCSIGLCPHATHKRYHRRHTVSYQRLSANGRISYSARTGFCGLTKRVAPSERRSPPVQAGGRLWACRRESHFAACQL